MTEKEFERVLDVCLLYPLHIRYNK